MLLADVSNRAEETPRLASTPGWPVAPGGARPAAVDNFFSASGRKLLKLREHVTRAHVLSHRAEAIKLCGAESYDSVRVFFFVVLFFHERASF